MNFHFEIEKSELFSIVEWMNNIDTGERRQKCLQKN